jgi:CheY-like chemotaxis protein
MLAFAANRRIELLMVEDNPGDVRLLREAFDEGGADVNFHVARDGAEALGLLLGPDASPNWRPDLILLDLNLPKISGHEVLRRLKADPDTKRIPVIILSSSRAESDVRKAYEAHANAYLKKPSTLEGLLAAAEHISNFWMRTATLPT